jgi:dephospho-CoA kinase
MASNSRISETPHPGLGSLHIGLTGLMASGKGEVAKILTEMGFSYLSLSDIVREEAKKLSRNEDGEPISRQRMQDIGNRLRAREGAGVLARMVVEKITAAPPGRWVIDGIRNPAEVEELRRLRLFFLIGIRASKPVLIARMRRRGRGTDIAEEEELARRLDREWGDSEPENGQQVGRCLGMAEYYLENNGTLKDLKKDVFGILSTIEAIHEQ